MNEGNISDALRGVDRLWHPSVIAELNGQEVKVARISGEFVWHFHTDADELFWVLSGRLVLRLRDREVVLGPGDYFVVPRGVEHLPVADGVVELVLFEPAGTRNTGNVREGRTVG